MGSIKELMVTSNLFPNAVEDTGKCKLKGLGFYSLEDKAQTQGKKQKYPHKGVYHECQAIRRQTMRAFRIQRRARSCSAKAVREDFSEDTAFA